MRDLLLGLLLLGLVPVAIMRPFLAVCVYAWISVMNPHRLTFGWAFDFNWAMLYGVVATIAVFWQHGARFHQAVTTLRWMMFFFLWTLVTTLFAENIAVSADYLVRFVKIVWPVVLLLMCVRSKREVTIFLAVIALSIGFYGVKALPWMIATGGEHRLTGPADSPISDNNHIAVALLTCVPILLWLTTQVSRRWMKWALWGTVGGCVLAALGTHSRGGFLTLLVLGGGLVLFSRRRGAMILVLVPLMAAALAFMPDKFWNRIDSIQEYQSDGSSMERLNTWTANFRLANDRILGAGFQAYKTRAYEPYSGDLSTKVRAAHSIWFQVLGEHGWIGLALFLTMFLSIVIQGFRFSRSAWADPDRRELVRNASLAILAFMVGGSFLSLAYWDFMFYLIGVTAAVVHWPELSFGVTTVPGAGVPRHVGGRSAVRRFGNALPGHPGR